MEFEYVSAEPDFGSLQIPQPTLQPREAKRTGPELKRARKKRRVVTNSLSTTGDYSYRDVAESFLASEELAKTAEMVKSVVNATEQPTVPAPEADTETANSETPSPSVLTQLDNVIDTAISTTSGIKAAADATIALTQSERFGRALYNVEKVGMIAKTDYLMQGGNLNKTAVAVGDAAKATRKTIALGAQASSKVLKVLPAVGAGLSIASIGVNSARLAEKPLPAKEVAIAITEIVSGLAGVAATVFPPAGLLSLGLGGLSLALSAIPGG